MKKVTRRKFMCMTAAAAAYCSTDLVDAQPTAGLALDTKLEIVPGATGTTMPGNFVGLSYESAQLADPTFFSVRNTALVQQFRRLSHHGDLRLGGCLSDFTNWWDPATQPEKPPMTPEIAAGQKRFEWIMTTPSVSKDKYAAITPESIKELRGFLDATGWNVVYGLNLGIGSAERAGAEGSCAVRELGNKLLALQVGNESDYFMHWKRQPTWNFDDYWTEYKGFVKAVQDRTPQAPFAGPDAAFLPWLQLYAERAQHEPVFLSSHYYRMGSAGGSAEKLLSPDPKLQDHIDAAHQAMKVSGVPYRMTEVNSCSHGGLAGVSDSYVSALWVIDFMLQVAQGGFSGVNLHGGGVEGVYSPIVGDANVGYTARPIVEGMRFANEFAGATFLTSKFTSNGCNVAAYAAEKQNEIIIAIVNKGDKPINCAVTGSAGFHTKKAELLRAPKLDSKTGVEMRALAHKRGNYSVPPYTALLVRNAA